MAKSSADGEREQYCRFLEDAAKGVFREAGLDKDGIRILIENRDEFRAGLCALSRRLSVSKQFGDEEVESGYGYPDRRPNGIVSQIACLHELFPEIGNADLKFASGEPPPNAEGWFAIPRWEKIAATYSAALERVFALISQARDNRDSDFYNWYAGSIGPQNFRRRMRTEVCLKELADRQVGRDILIVPAQFGFRHRGRSPRRACAVLASNEFGLGAFEVGIMLLTHPERLRNNDDLFANCPGDEYDDRGDEERFGRTPVFDISDGEVGFTAFWSDTAHPQYGSVSGFVPQQGTPVSGQAS